MFWAEFLSTLDHSDPFVWFFPGLTKVGLLSQSFELAVLDWWLGDLNPAAFEVTPLTSKPPNQATNQGECDAFLAEMQNDPQRKGLQQS